MITGIGTDIIEIARIESAITRRKFIDRVFTPDEQVYCMYQGVSAERFAGRFAAKEAVAKALGCSLSWLDVEILPDQSGKPLVKLSNEAMRKAEGKRILVTISHCRSYAVAYAVAVSD